MMVEVAVAILSGSLASLADAGHMPVITDECLTDGSAARLLDHLQHCLANHFDVEHSTFQVEAAGHADHEPGTHD